jgi:hypothetical protein
MLVVGVEIYLAMFISVLVIEFPPSDGRLCGVDLVK